MLKKMAVSGMVLGFLGMLCLSELAEVHASYSSSRRRAGSSSSSSSSSSGGGVSGSSINLKKSSYQKHLDEQAASGGSGSGSAASAAAAPEVPYRSRTLQSRSPQRAKPFSGESNYTTRDYVEDHNFLVTLSKNIPNPSIKKNLYFIIDELKTKRRFSQKEYDFLAQLSRSVNNRQVAERLQVIAEKYT